MRSSLAVSEVKPAEMNLAHIVLSTGLPELAVRREKVPKGAYSKGA
jgi:hypothetical protein